MTAGGDRDIVSVGFVISELAGMLAILHAYVDDRPEYGVALTDALSACQRMAEIARKQLDPIDG